MMPDGRLYLSTAAKAGPGQTRATLADCEGVCSALFGETLSLGGDGWVHPCDTEYFVLIQSTL